MLTTTFRLLHEADACVPRYKHLAKALGGIKKYGKDTPIPLVHILGINGWRDAKWCLNSCVVFPTEQLDERNEILRLYEYWDCDAPLDVSTDRCAQKLKELLNESR